MSFDRKQSYKGHDIEITVLHAQEPRAYIAFYRIEKNGSALAYQAAPEGRDQEMVAGSAMRLAKEHIDVLIAS